LLVKKVIDTIYIRLFSWKNQRYILRFMARKKVTAIGRGRILNQNWNLPKDTVINIVTYTSCEIHGNAQIIALENGDGTDLSPFSIKDEKRTYKGRCLCIIKVGNNLEEEVKLSVNCAEIEPQQLVLKTKP